MSARNCEPPFPGGIWVPPHPSYPPHPVIIDEQLAAQHDDIQTLLGYNQRLAATHVALRQEVEATEYQLQEAAKYAQALHAEKDSQMRELYEKSIKMENDCSPVNAMRSELMQVRMDIKELNAARQDLTRQVRMMTQDLGRVTSDLQQVPALKAEIEGLRHEMERVRTAIEHEKKRFAENLENGKLMECSLIAMAREMEKLQGELVNAERRAPAIAAGNLGYLGNPYPVGYGMMLTNPMHPAAAGGEGYPPPYVPGATWGSYDSQQGQG